MNLTVANFLYDDRFGGPYTIVFEVATALRKDGVAMQLVLPHGSGTGDVAAREKGVSVTRVRYRHWSAIRQVRITLFLLLLPLHALAVANYLKASKTDVAHVNGSLFLAGAIGARLADVPLAWHLDDTRLPKLLTPVVRTLARLLGARIVVPADAVARYYGFAKDRVVRIYPPVDQSRFKPKPAGDRAAHEPLRIGLIANWNPLKGIDIFVRAVDKLRTLESTPIRFVMAGARLDTQAGYTALVESLISDFGLRDCIDDCGFVSDVSDLTAGLDILVLSSRSEACPIAIVEAMACGVPVVATDAGGAREILTGGDLPPAGMVVATEDPVALAESMRSLVRDPQSRAAFGTAGVDRASRYFSQTVCARSHLRLYCELAGRPLT